MAFGFPYLPHKKFISPSALKVSQVFLLLLLVRQMETPVSPMKVASLRLPYSLRATGVWSGQIPFLSGS